MFRLITAHIFNNNHHILLTSHITVHFAIHFRVIGYK